MHGGIDRNVQAVELQSANANTTNLVKSSHCSGNEPRETAAANEHRCFLNSTPQSIQRLDNSILEGHFLISLHLVILYGLIRRRDAPSCLSPRLSQTTNEFHRREYHSEQRNTTAVSMKRSLVDVNADAGIQRKRQFSWSSVPYGLSPGAIQGGNTKVRKLNDQCLLSFQNACKEALERDASADLGPLFEEHDSRYSRLRRLRENQARQDAQGLWRSSVVQLS